MREGPGTERLGMAQRRMTLPVLAGERGGCGQALGGQGCLRPDGEPGEESMVGLRGAHGRGWLHPLQGAAGLAGPGSSSLGPGVGLGCIRLLQSLPVTLGKSLKLCQPLSPPTARG